MKFKPQELVSGIGTVSVPKPKQETSPPAVELFAYGINALCSHLSIGALCPKCRMRICNDFEDNASVFTASDSIIPCGFLGDRYQSAEKK